MPNALILRRQPGRRPPRRRFFLPRLLLLVVPVIALVVGAVFFFAAGRPEAPEESKVPRYPIAYEAEIREQANAFGLEAARVMAVVFCESSFQADAVSSAGARGLMQIMPETGAWLAEKFEDMGNFEEDMLFDPAVNLRLGCWYLRYLDDRFGGDLVTVTAAYHTGQGHVDEWLQDTANSPDGRALQSIPSDVTATYVGRVMDAYEQYKELLTQ